METDLVKKGKKLSFLLRHDKEYKFDEHGYRSVLDLFENHGYTMDDLIDIVTNNDKKRFEFNKDFTKIRARQGHSVEINVDLKEQTPPDVLYHGTATRFADSINEKGILKMNRNHVHLSADIPTAVEVGRRHGSPCVFAINTKKMVENGIKFYLSNNNVWLTDYVSPIYFTKQDEND